MYVRHQRALVSDVQGLNVHPTPYLKQLQEIEEHIGEFIAKVLLINMELNNINNICII